MCKITNPLISICIVAYNLENYIASCIESALRQDYENYEIVIVDNGSDDRTVEICQRYAQLHERIRFIALPRPTRVVRGHIEAVRQAYGEYIHLIDGDDCVRENYLPEMAQIILQRKPDLIMGTFECIVEPGATNYMDVKLITECINDVPVEQAVEYIFSLPYFNRYVWRFIVKKEMFRLVDFGEETKYLTGVDGLKSTIWLLNCTSIYYCDKPFYFYRRRLGSTVLSKNNRFTMDFIKLVIATAEELEHIHNMTKRRWAIQLETPQIEQYLKMFLCGSDQLCEDELQELYDFLKKKRSLAPIFDEYKSNMVLGFVKNYLMAGSYQMFVHAVNNEIKSLQCKLEERDWKKFYIFPSGMAAFQVQRMLNEWKYDIAGFIDNDIKKDGTVIYGIQCQTIDHFCRNVGQEERNQYGYVIVTMYEKLEQQFKEQLLQAGISKKNIIVRKFEYGQVENLNRGILDKYGMYSKM